MSNNKNDENHDNTYPLIKELLQELYSNLFNMGIIEYENNKLNEFTRNFLFEYDLDPKNLFETITSNSQNVFHYSSLIGFFYQYGIGCKVDEIKAFEIFSNAVKNSQKVESNQFSFDRKIEEITDVRKLNEIIAQYFYSLFLYKDIILDRKYNYKLHIRNAVKGDPVSQYFIGNCYHYSTKNFIKAIEWYSKSSEKGNVEAMYMLGYCYYYGYGIMNDRKKAFELYLKSAEGGNMLGLYKVIDCYYYGNGSPGILKDRKKAFEWCLKAAKKGHAHSQYLVAKYYNDGKHIPKDKEKGFYWNRKAAIRNDFNAQRELADYYLNNSINKNEKKAFNYYLKSSSNYNSRAMYLVAKCYRDGIGTDKNLNEAEKWFNKCNSCSYPKISITLDNFLNGSNISSFD